MTTNLPMADAELDAIRRRADAASKGPWRAYIACPEDGFESFIQIGGIHYEPNMHVFRDGERANDADIDFIAAARQDNPRLIAEIKRLRRELDHTI